MVASFAEDVYHTDRVRCWPADWLGVSFVRARVPSLQRTPYNAPVVKATMDKSHASSARYLAAGILLWLGNSSPSPGQLPSESTLPGRQPSATALPAESTLPATQRKLENAATIARTLPSESQLPPNRVAVQPTAVVTYRLPKFANPAKSTSLLTAEGLAELVQTERSPDGTPWLRLQSKGHVGRIRALAFSDDANRLCSAGDDKRTFVWGPTSTNPGGQPEWRYQRSIPWQIQRGPRGRIYALATSGDLLAIAGHGAAGRMGEIVLVNARTGNLEVVLVNEAIGHRQVIAALCFSPDPAQRGLASVDREGRALYWKPDDTGQWRAQLVQPPDRERYQADLARRLSPYRESTPIVMLDGRHLVLPVYQPSKAQVPYPFWQLHRFDVTTRTSQPLLAEASAGLHRGMVTTLACSRDGTRLASADLAQYPPGPNGSRYRFFIWDLRNGEREQKLIDRLPLSLAFSGNGRTLLVGTRRSKDAMAVLQHWNTSNIHQLKKQEPDLPVSDDVRACAISPDGAHLAYAAGAELFVNSTTQPVNPQPLRGAIAAPLRVACARQGPGYQVAIGTQREQGAVRLTQRFNATVPQLDSRLKLDPQNWSQADDQRGNWELTRGVPAESNSVHLQLQDNGHKAGYITFDPNLYDQRAPRCWIADANGQPAAIALSAKNNNIYIFKLVQQDACPILRVFRGHSSDVTSLALTHDRRYLVSAALDGTVRFWPLAQLANDNRLLDRWGARWAIVESGALEVTSIRKDGPLYFRGVRRGDQLTALSWYDRTAVRTGETPVRTARAARAMLTQLQQASWNALLVFDFQRGRARGPVFQMFPAWQPLASLVVSDNREWAFWSPAGYYDASFEGHRLFGWQVNRGLRELPDVFLADQFRKALERPEAMRRLLETGNLDDALLQVEAKLPTETHRAVAEAYALKPTVQIVSPVAGSLLDTPVARLRATITIRNGQRLVPPKAFANGVLATHRRRVKQTAIPGGTQITYAWDAALPSQRRIRLQVLAATEGEAVGRATVTVQRNSNHWRRSRLFIATAGINEYRDAQLPRLEFAVNNATQVAQTFQQSAQPLYRTFGLAMADQRVTRPVWFATLQQYAAHLRQHVTADDLLVIFLSGHGLRDQASDTYYYVTANARFRDLAARRYRDCFSFDAFTLFADIPCRKLVILDTCHSGALQPLHQRELKSALRALQDDLVFTLTATEGQQEAVEERSRKLGRFTHRLLEALRGAADTRPGNEDGIVSWRELIQYVKTTVRADSLGDPYQQFPTAGPADLLEFADFPVSQVAGNEKTDR